MYKYWGGNEKSMSFFVKNLKRSILAHIKINIIILFNMMLATLIIFVLLQNFYFLRERHDVFFAEDRTAKTFNLSIDADMFQTLENDAWNKTAMYEMALHIYDDINLTEMKIYKYSETYIYSDYLDDLTQNKLNGYSEINVYEVSEYTLEGLGLTLSEGRWFTSDEFVNINDSQYIPIVIGNQFSDSFNVGDIIEFNNDEFSDKAVIIGILSPNVAIQSYGTVNENINRSFVVPLCGGFDRSSSDLDMLNREKMRIVTQGYLFCPDENIDVQKAINKFVSKYGYYTITASPIDGTAYTETKSISERNLLLIGILAFVVAIVLTISIGGILYNRALDDRRTYCIYMSVGIPLWKINISIITEMLFLIMLSLIPVLILSWFEYKTLLIPIWQILLFDLIIIGVSLIPSLIANTKCNIDLLIRNQIV